MKADSARLARDLGKQNRSMRFELLADGVRGTAKNGDTLAVTLGADGMWQAVRVVRGATYTATATHAMLAAIKCNVLVLEAARG